MIKAERALRLATGSLYGLLVGSVAFTIGGMAALLFDPSGVGQVGGLLPWLMATPTWIYMLTVPTLVFLVYSCHAGWGRRVGFVVLGSSLGLTAELIGTNTGYPFGSYSYADFLGPRILGDVPYLIPLSWYATSVLALDFATRFHLTRAKRIVAAAGLMVLWDVALDPAMTFGFPVWQWHVDGFFYGMPFVNLVGWFVTSLAIASTYELFGGGIRPRSESWTVRLWLTSAALPLGISLVRGMWVAVFIGATAVMIPVAVVWWREVYGSAGVAAARHAT